MTGRTRDSANAVAVAWVLGLMGVAASAVGCLAMLAIGTSEIHGWGDFVVAWILLFAAAGLLGVSGLLGFAGLLVAIRFLSPTWAWWGAAATCALATVACVAFAVAIFPPDSLAALALAVAAAVTVALLFRHESHAAAPIPALPQAASPAHPVSDVVVVGHGGRLLPLPLLRERRPRAAVALGLAAAGVATAWALPAFGFGNQVLLAGGLLGWTAVALAWPRGHRVALANWRTVLACGLGLVATLPVVGEAWRLAARRGGPQPLIPVLVPFAYASFRLWWRRRRMSSPTAAMP